MNIAPMQDSVLFEFVQATKNGYFRHETNWGFTMDNIADYDMGKSRWGLVKDIGPDVTEIKVGDYILIEAGKWTNAVEVNGQKLWRTKESFVEGTTDQPPEI